MEGKTIILGRVSTEGQDLDQQTAELLRAAKNDGWTDKQIITISVKESGISLRESERKGLNDMKHLIESDDTIKCVYIYEVTRLARRGDVNFNIKQYLVDRKIQMVCLKPEIRLLNADGTINQMANVAFGMLAVFAEQEMYNSKDRMQRGKIYAKMQGRNGGGQIRYGYATDKRKFFIVDEHEAAVVREVFDMMCSGEHSMNSIAREMIERGEFVGLKEARKKVRNILHCVDYCGEGYSDDRCYKSQHKYPAIIDYQTYLKARAELDRNQHKAKRVYKHIFYGRGIVKDVAGYCVACVSRRGSNYYRNGTSSTVKVQIGSAPVDTSLWFIAKSQYENVKELNKMAGVDKTKKAIDELTQKIRQAEKNVAELTDKIDRVEERYIAGKISSDKADRMEEDFRKQMDIENRNIVKFNDQMRQLENPVEDADGIGDINAITDAELKYKIVKMVLDYVTVIRNDTKTATLEVHYKPMFTTTEGFTQNFTLTTKRGQQTLRLGNEWELPLKILDELKG